MVIKNYKNFIIGLFIFLIPFLGFPLSFKFFLVGFCGLLLSFLSLSFSISDKSLDKEEVFESHFIETQEQEEEVQIPKKVRKPRMKKILSETNSVDGVNDDGLKNNQDSQIDTI